jgi:hypothetical protein
MSDYEDENEYEQEEYEPEYEEEHEDEYEDEYEEEQEFEPEYHEYEEEYEKEFEDVPEYQEDFQEEEFGKGVEMNAFGEGGRLYFISDRDNLFRKFESNKNKSQLQRFQEIIAVTCNTLKIKEKINIIIPYTDDIKDVSNLNAPCFVLGYLCIKDNEINIYWNQADSPRRQPGANYNHAITVNNNSCFDLQCAMVNINYIEIV